MTQAGARCAALLALCAVFSAASGDSTTPVPEPSGLWSGPINSDVPATIAGGKVVHAAEVAKLIDQANAFVIDVSNLPKRPEGMAADAPWLPLPQEVIPGSVWIPDVGAASISEQLDEFFRAQLHAGTNGALDHPVVIYCHERCWLSWNAAKRAIGYGFRNVHWFPDGIEGWRAAGFRTETANPRLPSDHP